MAHRRSRRAGFTLAELLLSITLTIAVFSAAVPFFTLQMRQLQQDLGRSDAQQTARFAQNMVDRELRNIGIAVTPMQPSLGIPRNQPKIVQAAAFAVTFNSNLVANDTVDMNAVYYDPNVPANLTTSLPSTNMVALPLSGPTYPDYVYRDNAGMLSMAETISYWATVDSTAGASDHYVVFRRVNDGPVQVVARGIKVPAGQAMFQYKRVMANGSIDSVTTATLPIYWNSASGLADSIRTVTMSVRGVFQGYDLQNKTKTWERNVSTQTNMPNIGLSQRNSCGDIPLNPGSPTAAIVLDPVTGATERVRITFAKSNDETSGEKDVERYAVFRRLVGDPWEEPVAVVGKSGGPYLYEDFDIQFGNTYQYGVAAQDCSPANSTILGSGVVTH
ncbi:MAG: type II secretion system protein [Gemmatimonadetes bacterium]|nr:type II secretion system protein [Gemmatimonadota bacterium]